MRCIYNYVLGTNRVSMVHNVSARVFLKYVVHVMLFPIINVLYFYIITLPSVCAMPSMAVFFISIVAQIFTE
jgi:hypothetical protein